jgi:hypothetical protein
MEWHKNPYVVEVDLPDGTKETRLSSESTRKKKKEPGHGDERPSFGNDM